MNNSGPLSYGQRALWFLQQLAPESAAYNVAFAARCEAEFDIAALRGAFQSVVNRHPALRTVFPAVQGKPVQKVLSSREIDFEAVEASQLRRDELLDRLVLESHRPFDLENGPVLRVKLFSRSPREQFISLVMHHIVADFVSLVIILDELRAFYTSATAGDRLCLPDLTSGYLDYARWQEEMLGGPEGERLWGYWQKRLRGDLPKLELPTDRPRLQVQSYRGRTLTIKLDERVSRQIKSRAESEGLSLFTLLLASYQVLLARYSGQSRILVGSPPVGRRRAEFEGVVGFFHNPVVLSADLSDNPSFEVFGRRVERTVVDAFEHQDYPFPLLVERLQPVRDPGRSPLFQTMFVLYEAGERSVLSALAGEAGTRIDLGGLELESLGLEQRAAMLDLTLTLVRSGASLIVRAQYNTDLFDASTVTRMIEDYQRVLEAVCSGPVRRVSEIPLSIERQTPWAGSSESVRERSLEEAPAKAKQLEFSLLYFASEDSNQSADDKYRLLIEGAKFADSHGFCAVWTPERHFHAFGGLYPNPSVTGAAIATITGRVKIRAGSVVLPLHHPVRVAEEWAVVDNLSNGRVGLSFASGWHADDFIFAPERFSTRREVMARHVDIVRRLWRGESVPMTGGLGNEVQVKIMPRPVQTELPVWLTAFGSVETFRLAGEIGANMLTHLLGQSVELVAEKIKLYRKAWRDHGHPGSGHVTLMLHTFVTDDYEAAREKVRDPFCNYLRSSLDLLMGLAASAGIEVDPSHLTPQNIDALVSHAFNRYYETCGLFGTPDTCMRMVEKVKRAGIDEVACLIDFGIDADSVLSSLSYLNILKCESERANRAHEVDAPGPDFNREINVEGATLPLQETLGRAEIRRSLMKRKGRSRVSIGKG